MDKKAHPLIYGNPPMVPKATQALGAIIIVEKLGEGSCVFTYGKEAVNGGPLDGKKAFELASITKTFTAAILGLRVVEGELNLNETVEGRLPSKFQLSEGEKELTFQQLATFTAGFNSDNPPGDINGKPFSFQRFVNYVNSLTPTRPIQGEKYLPTYNLYSNSSFALLGVALMYVDDKEQKDPFVYDEPAFSAWIAKNLTGPGLLDMPNTTVWPSTELMLGHIYNKRTNTYHPASKFPWTFKGPAGALRSTAKDMGAYMKAQVCAYALENENCRAYPSQLLEALKLTTTVQDFEPSGALSDPAIKVTIPDGKGDEYVQALAWIKRAKGESEIMMKVGGHPGFHEWIGFGVQKNIGVMVLTNTGNTTGIESVGVDIINHLHD